MLYSPLLFRRAPARALHLCFVLLFAAGCGDALVDSTGTGGSGLAGTGGAAGGVGIGGSGGAAGAAGGTGGAAGSAGDGGSAGNAGSGGTAGSAGTGGTGGMSPPPPAGSFVTPDDIGSIVGASNLSSTLNGDQNLNSNGQVLENVTLNGCITINADNVTIRNVRINCDDTYPIKDNRNSGTVVERVTIDCMNNTSKGIYFDRASNFTVDRTHITRCDDQFFIDGGLGSSSIVNSVFHNQAPAGEAHTDGMQVGTFETTTGTLAVIGNWWEYNRQGCCQNAVLFLSGQSQLTVELRDNFFDDDFGTHVLRCRPASNCIVENNVLNGPPEGLFIQSSASGAGVARCNRYPDGSFVPNSLYSGVIVDNSDC